MTLRWKDSNLLTLLALVLGVTCGLLIHRSGATSWTWLVELAAAVGTLAVNALRLTIIPLIFAMLVVATSARGSAGARILGLSTVTFAALLVLGATYSMTVTSALIRGFQPPSTTLAASSHTDSTQDTDEKKEEKPPERSGWKMIGELLPSNLLRAAANDEFLPIVLFAILLGLATARLNSELSSPLIQFFDVSAQVLRILTGWVLTFLPIGVFGIALSTTAASGTGTLGVLGYWIGLICLVLSLFILLLYVVARVAGGIPLRDFAKSLFEAQAVAFATRSSIAALPALLRGAETHLPGARHVAPLVLGLSAGGFKLNRAVSSICRLIFLAHVYSITLTVETVAVFTVTSLLTNLATPGVPSQGTAPTLPLYLAAGIPIEGVVLLGSVDLIPDFFMTLLNVTGDMTAVAIVARFSAKPEAVLD
jgi:proton glutamate symport protein